ncbi:hypothetical protein IMCC3317_33750 [Kordia antarctica]|uniref:Uncharacterized protein n=1 Tax=Kordia antarctica TaxID=1218801 RepID=A0A7L4ZMV2_9FLAO|nr:hypothetical protein [Kordia antarctica]QHI37992.1 hypothetical protein IMCC3317_33750 [Kordia antarctica]
MKVKSIKKLALAKMAIARLESLDQIKGKGLRPTTSDGPAAPCCQHH